MAIHEHWGEVSEHYTGTLWTDIGPACSCGGTIYRYDVMRYSFVDEFTDYRLVNGEPQAYVAREPVMRTQIAVTCSSCKAALDYDVPGWFYTVTQFRTLHEQRVTPLDTRW